MPCRVAAGRRRSPALRRISSGTRAPRWPAGLPQRKILLLPGCPFPISRWDCAHERKQGYEDFNVYVTRANGSPVTFPLSNTSINGEKLGTIRESSFWNSSNPNTRVETRYTAGYDGKLGDAYDLKVNLGYFDRQSTFVGAGTGATFQWRARNDDQRAEYDL